MIKCITAYTRKIYPGNLVWKIRRQWRVWTILTADNLLFEIDEENRHVDIKLHNDYNKLIDYDIDRSVTIIFNS